MKKVICSGAIRDSLGHRCEQRKCIHRKMHTPVKGRCGVKSHNSEDGWCQLPETTSPLDGNTDGELVTCMTKAENLKKRDKLDRYILDGLQKSREELKQKMSMDKASLKILNKQIKMLKDSL